MRPLLPARSFWPTSPATDPTAPAGGSDEAWCPGRPDTGTALGLVKASRTTNVPVTVWGYSGDAGVGAYLVRLLTGLGYRAALHTVSASDYQTAISDHSRKIQIGLADFGADFPSPSTFFLSALSCVTASQPANANYAGYCSPGVDRLAGQAQAAEPADPAAARTLWAPGGPRSHRSGPVGTGIQQLVDGIRLRPDGKLPGKHQLRALARPDVGAVSGPR
jgi:hypothetical protein